MTYKYSKEILAPIFESSKSFIEVKTKLGLSPHGGNDGFKRYVKQYELDITHFTGQSWAKGRTKEDCKAIARTTQKITKHTVEKSLRDGIRIDSGTLHRLLKETGREKICEVCQTGQEWCGTKLSLHIDHINGNSFDNRPENLRYLCPNCHSQTKNFGSKNKHSYSLIPYIEPICMGRTV
jgi:hypothetical protein